MGKLFRSMYWDIVGDMIGDIIGMFLGYYWDIIGTLRECNVPSGKLVQFAIENGHRKIVSFPSNSIVIVDLSSSLYKCLPKGISGYENG